jgi:hypothetical protein
MPLLKCDWHHFSLPAIKFCMRYWRHACKSKQESTGPIGNECPGTNWTELTVNGSRVSQLAVCTWCNQIRHTLKMYYCVCVRVAFGNFKSKSRAMSGTNPVSDTLETAGDILELSHRVSASRIFRIYARARTHTHTHTHTHKQANTISGSLQCALLHQAPADSNFASSAVFNLCYVTPVCGF